MGVQNLSDESLLQAYQLAVDLHWNQRLIELFYQEIEKRELQLPPQHK